MKNVVNFGIKRLFPDVDFSVVEDDSIYFDLATNIIPNGNDVTFIWRTDPLVPGPSGSPLVNILFPDTRVNYKKYRKDMFAHVSNLGGFGCKNPGGASRYNIYAA